MAASKRQTTMAKFAREQRVKERRVLKQEKKAARRAGLLPVPDAETEPTTEEERPAEAD